MMIVDLIDEVDFKEKLIGIGAPIDAAKDLKEVDTHLVSWLDECPEQTYFVKLACQELVESNATILPEVKTIMKAYL